ncbi:uncharacterized protein LOC144323453 isoform X3 [Canis aureus]
MDQTALALWEMGDYSQWKDTPWRPLVSEAAQSHRREGGGTRRLLARPWAISCILDIWLEYYQEDFHQLPEFPSLKKLLEFMRQRMPGSDLEHRAWHYLKKFIHLHAAEPEAKASAREQHPEPPQKPAPASTVGPAAPSGPEVIEQVLAAGAEGLARTEIPAAESKPLQIVVTALFHCSTLEEPPAPLATPEEE